MHVIYARIAALPCYLQQAGKLYINLTKNETTYQSCTETKQLQVSQTGQLYFSVYVNSPAADLEDRNQCLLGTFNFFI